MADSFQFKLITPTGIVFEGAADQVSATGPLGEFGVLPAHTDFITSLTPGVLEVRFPDASTSYWVVSGGLAEVKDGVMTLLASSAEVAADVDPTAAAEEEKTADAALSQKSYYDSDYSAAVEALQLARARMRAAALKPAAH